MSSKVRDLIYLLEVTAHDGSTENTYRFSSGRGFTSKPSDTVPNTFYEPRIENPGRFTRNIFSAGATFGEVDVGFGEIVLNNADGGLDFMRTLGYGRTVRLYSLTSETGSPEDKAFSDAVLLFAGNVSHAEADFESLRLVIRDEMQLLDKPYSTAVYAGTSDATGKGTEGNLSAEGARKIAIFGTVRNMSPQLSNPSDEVYSLNHTASGGRKAVASVTALRNGGATYTLAGADFSTYSTLIASVPGLGTANTAKGEGLLIINGALTLGMTADVCEAPSVTNLIPRSETLGQRTVQNATVSAGAVSSLWPGVTADGLIPNTVTTTHRALGPTVTGLSGVVTGSVFIKAGGYKIAALEMWDGATARYAIANASTGVLDSASHASSTLDFIGDGWYRMACPHTVTGSTMGATVYVAVASGTAGLTHAGDGAGMLYITGFQMVESTAPEPYISTDQNLVKASHAMDNAVWNTAVAASVTLTVTPNDRAGPNGVIDADKLESTGGVSGYANRNQNVSTTATTFTLEAFSRYDSNDAWLLLLADKDGSSGNGRFGGYFDIANGATGDTLTASGGSVTRLDIDDFGDGWYRCRVIGTTPSAGTYLTFAVALAEENAGTYNVSGESLHVWGAGVYEGDWSGPSLCTEADGTIIRKAQATPGRIAQRVCSEHGKTITELSVLGLDRVAPFEAGIAIAQAETVKGAINTVLESVGGYLIQTASGTLVTGRYEAASGTSLKRIDDRVIIDDGSAKLAIIPVDEGRTGIPVYRVQGEFDRNWTLQTGGDLAGSVSQADRDDYGKRSKMVTVTASTLLTKHPEAREVIIPGVLVNRVDAMSEMIRRGADLQRDRTRLIIPMDPTEAVGLDIADQVTVDVDRFGLSGGTLVRIIGLDQDHDRAISLLDVVN